MRGDELRFLVLDLRWQHWRACVCGWFELVYNHVDVNDLGFAWRFVALRISGRSDRRGGWYVVIWAGVILPLGVIVGT